MPVHLPLGFMPVNSSRHLRRDLPLDLFHDPHVAVLGEFDLVLQLGESFFPSCPRAFPGIIVGVVLHIATRETAMLADQAGRITTEEMTDER